MPNKKLTLEDLAGMVKRGFDETATKEDIRELRDGLRAEMHEGFQMIAGTLTAIQGDIREVKAVLPPLLKTVAQLELDMGDLKVRVLKLERKAGLEK